MAKRKLLKDQDRRKLFDIPVDEDSFIRHYLLSSADRLEIERKRSADGVGLEVPWHQGFDVGGRPALSDAA